MKYNPDIHHRRSIRLKGYDYSQEGYYFITVCANENKCLFGEIENGVMNLNCAGKMIDYQWNDLARRFRHIELDEYIIMPNHFHGIIIVGATLVVAPITDNIRAGTRPAPTCEPTGAAPTIKPTKTMGYPTIGDMVGAFKSITSYEYINGVKINNWKPFDGKLWQRNYYEQILRNETSLRHIREYIVNNPYQWQQDELYAD
jgi:putative transposase